MRLQSNEIAVPISPETAAFAASIEAKLRMEGMSSVAQWEHLPIEELKRQLALKVSKLLQNPTEESLFMQSVVVGAFAMMIAEKSARAQKKALAKKASSPSKKNLQVVRCADPVDLPIRTPMVTH